METKKNKPGDGKTEHGNQITANAKKTDKKGKVHGAVHLPVAEDGGDGSGPKTEHGARGAKPL
jgi:hypothetical protein